MRNLDRLNTILQDKSLELPEFRNKVPENLSNIKWLKKALEQKRGNPVADEALTLLHLDPKTIFMPYSGA